MSLVRSPVGIYHEPAPDGGPLSSVEIPSNVATRTLNRIQRAADRASELLDDLIPGPL